MALSPGRFAGTRPIRMIGSVPIGLWMVHQTENLTCRVTDTCNVMYGPIWIKWKVAIGQTPVWPSILKGDLVIVLQPPKPIDPDQLFTIILYLPISISAFVSPLPVSTLITLLNYFYKNQ